MDKNDQKIKQKNKEEVVQEDVELLKNECEQLENRITELEDQLKRAVADYRNLERRSIEERIDAIKFANKRLVEALLPAFDTLFLAAKYTADESVKLTIVRILEILKDNGIEIVYTENVKYNPETMEGVEAVGGEKDLVIEEVRPGFTINGKLIRPAQVKVGNGEGVRN